VTAEVPIDALRLAQEIRLFAEACDITEELGRLRSHLTQSRKATQSQEAVGRKLDFLCQEMHREISTIAAKAKSASIAGVTIEFRTELERVREQVQNIA
jgi:uncharacterized protein (TIGR00255 family)